MYCCNFCAKTSDFARSRTGLDRNVSMQCHLWTQYIRFTIESLILHLPASAQAGFLFLLSKYYYATFFFSYKGSTSQYLSFAAGELLTCLSWQRHSTNNITARHEQHDAFFSFSVLLRAPLTSCSDCNIVSVLISAILGTSKVKFFPFLYCTVWSKSCIFYSGLADWWFILKILQS